jgi:hypothetical protein
MSRKRDHRVRDEYEDHGSGSYAESFQDNDHEELMLEDDSLLDITEITEQRAGEHGKLADGSSETQDRTPFSGTLSDRLDLLRDRIESLQQEIAERKRLHDALQQAIEAELTALDHLLEHVRIWSLGENASVDGRRTNLEREVIALKKAGWEENLRHWKDLVWMEKELQDVVERYKLARAAEGLTDKKPDEETR